MTRLRRNVLLSLVVVALLLILLLGGAWVLLRSDPSWYKAVQLTPEQQLAGQNRLIDRLATIRNAVGQSEVAVREKRQSEFSPIEVEFSEADVNGFLARWSEFNPQVREALQVVKEPHVRFLDDRIVLAGRSDELGSLVSVEISIDQTADGPRVSVGRPWAGKLPLSRSILSDPATDAIANLKRGRPTKLPPRVVESLESLVNGDEAEVFVPIATSLNTLVGAKVEKLSVKDGVLKATLRPSSDK